MKYNKIKTIAGALVLVGAYSVINTSYFDVDKSGKSETAAINVIPDFFVDKAKTVYPILEKIDRKALDATNEFLKNCSKAGVRVLRKSAEIKLLKTDDIANGKLTTFMLGDARVQYCQTEKGDYTVPTDRIISFQRMSDEFLVVENLSHDHPDLEKRLSDSAATDDTWNRRSESALTNLQHNLHYSSRELMPPMIKHYVGKDGRPLGVTSARYRVPPGQPFGSNIGNQLNFVEQYYVIRGPDGIPELLYFNELFASIDQDRINEELQVNKAEAEKRAREQIKKLNTH